MAVTAFPLCWPEGRKRTAPWDRAWGQFDHKRTRHQAAREMFDEIERLGGSDVILSSNLKLRQDGLPYSVQPKLEDPGIAVYFKLKERQMCFACDTFDTDAKNIWAIKKTIEAIRGIERWGSSDMMEQAFTGFEALPMRTPWWQIMEFDCEPTKEEAKVRYRELARKFHPDNLQTGNQNRMSEINTAFEESEARL